MERKKSKETFKTSTLYNYKGISILKSEISQTYRLRAYISSFSHNKYVHDRFTIL